MIYENLPWEHKDARYCLQKAGIPMNRRCLKPLSMIPVMSNMIDLCIFGGYSKNKWSHDG